MRERRAALARSTAAIPPPAHAPHCTLTATAPCEDGEALLLFRMLWALTGGWLLGCFACAWVDKHGLKHMIDNMGARTVVRRRFVA
eukprot:1187086-Prorocentrum_minimum.AAC.2